MPSGRPLVPLSLTAQQRRQLQSWAPRPKTGRHWQCGHILCCWRRMV
jgi:hypothetical protein